MSRRASRRNGSGADRVPVTIGRLRGERGRTRSDRGKKFATMRQERLGEGGLIGWHGGFQGEVSAPQLPVPVRGRWIRDARYADLRNTAWFVRNYRMVAHDDTLAVAKLCYAVQELLRAGEPLEAVVPSLVDLFLRP